MVSRKSFICIPLSAHTSPITGKKYVASPKRSRPQEGWTTLSSFGSASSLAEAPHQDMPPTLQAGLQCKPPITSQASLASSWLRRPFDSLMGVPRKPDWQGKKLCQSRVPAKTQRELCALQKPLRSSPRALPVVPVLACTMRFLARKARLTTADVLAQRRLVAPGPAAMGRTTEILLNMKTRHQ